ncbi:MAG TPA: acylphosphatase [Candidatus Binatia bacterium]|jgi:acylphosphatase
MEAKIEDNIRARIRVEGRVQGVFFRASAQAEAHRLGVRGWVRNCHDGSVELVAEGKRKDIDDLIAWCRHGPRGAEVANVQVERQEFGGEFSGFRITR